MTKVRSKKRLTRTKSKKKKVSSKKPVSKRRKKKVSKKSSSLKKIASKKNVTMKTSPKKKALKSLSFRQAFAVKLIDLLNRYYPGAECALDHSTPEELLIATILSAQCTDERVNIVTKSLFKKYQSPKDFAEAPLEDLEEDIRSTGFFRNKAKNIQSCCKDLVELYDSKVPQKMSQLTRLGGVGRKTANVVLGNAFGIASGVVVDTHVTRLSNRFGLVDFKNAEKIEQELNQIVPQKHWIMFSHWLIHHGRQICKARKPDCSHCFMQEICPQIGVE